jgi:hypothetical protein
LWIPGNSSFLARQFSTVRQVYEAAGQETTILAAQYFVNTPIEGGQFGTGLSPGAYFCSDAATKDDCKAIVLQTARWEYPESASS